MSIKNRELSQFGSFIYIDDSTRTIGIATTATPYVAIGATNSNHKFTVVGGSRFEGNLQSTGIISASSYYLNGNPLVDAINEVWDLDDPNIYRLNGSVGIGTSIPSERLSVLGNVSASKFISTISNGTSPIEVLSQTLVSNLNADYLRGKTPPVGDIVGTGDAQILTNKTLILPSFTGTGVNFNGSISGVTNLRASSSAGNNNLNLPTTNGTLICTGDTGVVTSNMISDLSITNVDVASGAGISYTKLNLSDSIKNSDINSSAGISYSKLNLSNSITNSDIAIGAGITNGKLANPTISGISLGDNLNDLSAGSFITFNSGTTYNGNTAKTISVSATPSNTPSTIISRDSSGGFNAASLSVTSTNTTLNSSLLVTGITTVGLGTTSFPSNSQMSFDLTNNTNLRINVKGNDSVLRSVNITLNESGELITAGQDEFRLFW